MIGIGAAAASAVARVITQGPLILKIGGIIMLIGFAAINIVLIVAAFKKQPCES